MPQKDSVDEGNFLWRSIGRRDSPVPSLLGRHFRGEGLAGREIYLTDIIETSFRKTTAVLSVDGIETEFYSTYCKVRPHPIEAYDLGPILSDASRRYGYGNLVKDHRGDPWAFDLVYPGAGRAIYWADGQTWPFENAGARMRILHSRDAFTEYISVWRDRDADQDVAARLALSGQPSEDRVLLAAAFTMLIIRMPSYYG